MDEYETSVSLISSTLGDRFNFHLVFPPPELYMIVVLSVMPPRVLVPTFGVVVLNVTPTVH